MNGEPFSGCRRCLRVLLLAAWIAPVLFWPRARKGVMMNPFVVSLIGSVVRWAITIAAAHGVAVSEDQGTQIAAGAVAVLTLLWSWYQKMRADRKITEAKLGL